MALPSAAPARERVNPVLVELTRGRRIESIHRGAVAVVAANGDMVAAFGDIDRPVFVRSAAKPLQALSLIETGAADAFALGQAELALACGSHGGEPCHIGCVTGWLAKLGLDQSALVCGPHPPLDAEASADLARRGAPPTRVHNNCSGKHAGFLTVARHLGLPLGGYGDPDHPLQSRVRRDIEEIGGLSLGDDMLGIDGCGVAAFALPLRALAFAFARLGRPAELAPERAAAVRRLSAAMVAHPGMVAGRGRFDSVVIRAAAGRILSKGGAEGVHAAALVDAGLGIAVKIDDGGKRAAEAAIAAAILAHADVEAARFCLAGYAGQTLHNAAGAAVGELRPAAGWLKD